MLLGQNGCWSQQNGLFAGQNRLENSPNRHLRLAITHIPAYQSVHGTLPFHVSLGFGDGFDLIPGGFINELRLKFRLPFVIWGKGISR